jgi:hypothetical protein
MHPHSSLSLSLADTLMVGLFFFPDILYVSNGFDLTKKDGF